MPSPKFEKGRKKTGGREKGTPNKFTTLRQSWLDAYNSEEMGSTQGLINAFSVNPATKREFYKTISKMLPSNVDVGVSGEITHKLSITGLKKSLNDYKENGS